MKRLRALCLCVASIGAVASCRGDKAVAPGGPCGDAVTTVQLNVTLGATPTFDWTPACPAYLFLVENRSTGHDQWVIADSSGDTTSTANTIHPPLVYGVRPAGTTENSEGPQPLVTGTDYTIAVWRILSSAQAANKCQGQIGPLCLMAVTFITP